MDTRKKIVHLHSLPGGQANLRIAKGWFDVLTAEHCELLRKAKGPEGILVVLVYIETETRPAPLTASDRAQMVAALGAVDWVCACDAEECLEIETRLQPEAVLDVEAVRQRDVVRDVLEQHASR